MKRKKVKVKKSKVKPDVIAPPIGREEQVRRLKCIVAVAVKNNDSKTAFEAEKELNKYQAVVEPLFPEQPIVKLASRDKIMDALDEHLGFLTDDINVDYPELIKMAGDMIKEFGAAKC